MNYRRAPRNLDVITFIIFLFFFLLISIVKIFAGSLPVAWDQSISTNVVGYKLYESLEDGPFQFRMNAATNALTFDIKPAQKYRFHVTAYNQAGLESDPSNEITYTENPKLKILVNHEGPNLVITLLADVFTGMNYEILGTRDFASWQVVSIGTTTSDSLSVPFNPTEPYLSFRLKKASQSFRIASIDFENLIPPLTYTPPTRWQKLKHTLRYRPGLHPIETRGAYSRGSRKRILEVRVPPMPESLRVQ